MQQFKTLFIAGVVILFLVGATVWWFTRPGENAQRPPINGVNLNDPNISSVTTNGGAVQPSTSASQPSIPTDLAGEYIKLFEKIGATAVLYKATTASTEGEVASVYALYAKDIADARSIFPNMKEEVIDIGFVDLTDDGVAEAVAWVGLPSCGSGGCPLDIYRKDKKTWKLLLSTVGARDVGVARSFTDGYADIFVTVSGDVGYVSNVMRFTWNGSQYVPWETMGRWNGQTFLVN